MSVPFVVFGQDVETSASIGIAMAPEHGDSYDDLLSRADEAMYRAKALGRDGFQMFSGPHTPRRAGSLPIDPGTLEAELSEALPRHQFFVVYQPYIDLRTSEVVGVEALVRWRHPRLGILEPPSFISVAERSDVIVALDSWVLEQACMQARAGSRGARPIPSLGQLGVPDLSDPELFANVHRTLARTGIRPVPARARDHRTGRAGPVGSGQGEHRAAPAPRSPVHHRRLRRRELLSTGSGPSRSAPSRSTSRSSRSSGPRSRTTRWFRPSSPWPTGSGWTAWPRGRDLPAEPGPAPAGLFDRPGVLLQPAVGGR